MSLSSRFSPLRNGGLQRPFSAYNVYAMKLKKLKFGDCLILTHILVIVSVSIMTPRWCAMVAGCFPLHQLLWDKYYHRNLFYEP